MLYSWCWFYVVVDLDFILLSTLPLFLIRADVDSLQELIPFSILNQIFRVKIEGFDRLQAEMSDAFVLFVPRTSDNDKKEIYFESKAALAQPENRTKFWWWSGLAYQYWQAQCKWGGKGDSGKSTVMWMKLTNTSNMNKLPPPLKKKTGFCCNSKRTIWATKPPRATPTFERRRWRAWRAGLRWRRRRRRISWRNRRRNRLFRLGECGETRNRRWTSWRFPWQSNTSAVGCICVDLRKHGKGVRSCNDGNEHENDGGNNEISNCTHAWKLGATT